MVTVWLQVPIESYNWFCKRAEEDGFSSVNEYLETLVFARYSEATKGGSQGGFVYTGDKKDD